MMWKLLLSTFATFVAIRGTIGTAENCDSPLDLFFVLDGSSSLGPPNFRKVKEFAATVVSRFTISPTATRVGVVQYSHYATLEFNLGDYDDMLSTLAKINRIVYQRGATYTNWGLDLARKKAKWREDETGEPVPKVMIVLTDGQSARDVTEASQALAEEGIIVYCIGVGNVDPAELLVIANNDASKVIALDDFNALVAEIDQISIVVCEVAIERADPCFSQPCQNGGTCITLDENLSYECQCPHDYAGSHCEIHCAIDVVFVVDASSSIQNNWFNVAKQFIIEFDQCFTGQDIGLGVITYDCVPRTAIPLGLYTAGYGGFMYAIVRVPYTGGLSGTAMAISFMTHTSNFRAGVPRAAVIITDGDDQDGMSGVAAMAQDAMDAGITLYGVVNGGIPGFTNINALEVISGGADNVFSIHDDACQVAYRILGDLYPCGMEDETR
ncbi:von Willebrand factor A domain-containing protein 2-like [Branchiostoma floridae x Branchiostoma belcheri]